MINLHSGDVNKLRQMLASGQITEDQLLAMSFHGGDSAPQQAPQNALAQALSPQQAFARGDTSGDLPMGSMRNEATGKITYFQPDPQAPRTNADPGFSDTPYPLPSARPQSPSARLYGYGDGGLTDLGEDTSGAIPLDYSRGQIEVPGVGKAHYSRDGRFAVARGPNGEAVKVMLGYDAAASDRRNAVALDREKTMAEIARTNQGIEASKEQVLASQVTRNAKEGLPGFGVTQKRLIEQFGAPDKGYVRNPDGTQSPERGGKIEKDAQISIDKARDAISQIDALIGKRNTQGELVDGKVHPGFEAAVGSGFGKTFGSLSDYYPFATEGRDFSKRLDQLKGGAFLEAFQTLKGGGQITEVEGKKATAAITRMDTAQSEPEFIQAAIEFRTILARGLERAKGNAPRSEGNAAQPGREELDSMPSPSGNEGKMLTMPNGSRYRSDGKNWKRL